MKILVTGGAGFIGSNFCRYMLKKYPSYKVTVYDILTYASNPGTVLEMKKNKNFSFIHADITDKKAVEKAMKGMDAVVNFAAETHVDRSIMEPGVFVDTNVKGTSNLLEAALANKISRFIQIGTDEVYGSIAKGRSKEGDMLDPTSPYSSTKTSADLIALAYYKTFKLPVMVTRSSNNFGPYQHPEKFVPLFITNAIEGKQLPLYGDGKNVRNWIHVDDNCSGLDIILHKGAAGEIYNIGGNVEIPNITVAKTIIKLLGKDESIMKFVTDRPAHDRRYALDSAKLKKLGWKPDYNFEKALELTVSWYMDNKAWWEELKGHKFNSYYKKLYSKR